MKISEALIQFKMEKLFLLNIFYLISGSEPSSDVISYSGGRVTIYTKNPTSIKSVYFCKIKTQTECEDLITAQVTVIHKGVQKDRLSLIYSEGIITLIFRNLSLQDNGTYQIGDFKMWNHNINLRVKRDPCCSGTKRVRGDLGQTLMISCSYPVEFETNTKVFYRLDDIDNTELIRTSRTQQNQEGRFSISDDRRNKVFRVNITDVREDDYGDYSCAVINEGTEVGYFSLFTVIQLRATDDPTENPEEKLDPSESGSFITITVVVSVLLLLAVGLVLIFYKLRNKRSQGLSDRNVMESLQETLHYDEIKDHTPYSNTEENVYYSTISLPTIPSDPQNTLYTTAQLPTIPSDPPNTLYTTAQLPTIPSDPPNTLYTTAQLPTIPSDPPNTLYTTAQLPTIPSDPPNTLYTTAQLPTIPSDLPN